MTGQELEMLKYKEKQGTLTSKERRKLRQHRRDGGRTSGGYSGKKKSYQN